MSYLYFILSLMIEITIYHNGIRGDQLSPPQNLTINKEEAESYVANLPHVKGKEFYYAVHYNRSGNVLFDPTGEHMTNVQQRFLKALLV
jgi:hypothetical protein